MADLSAECRRGSWWTLRLDDNDGDGWRECDDAMPIFATTLDGTSLEVISFGREACGGR
ncbi:hypothetical protein GCM10023235_00970 [Kitasatospora terrestris]|uniref:Uncharacterized protein n=1 Tax=Kitasatospora terrestris TaxID=258051 RepID=A0ABP9D6X6_9ACTN